MSFPVSCILKNFILDCLTLNSKLNFYRLRSTLFYLYTCKSMLALHFMGNLRNAGTLKIKHKLANPGDCIANEHKKT